MRVSALVVVVAVASIAAACGASAGDENTIDDGTSPPPPELDGTSWRLVAGGGPAGSIELVDGHPITITFDGNQLSGTAACNGYGGTYRLNGNTLQFSELSQTEMACQPVEVMESEQAYLTALLDIAEVTTVGDELVLGGSTTELVFARQAEIPQAELIGPTWVLETLVQGETASSVAGDPATLRLNADGTFIGSTGCRTVAGDYLVSGASVQFTSWQADGDCPSDLTAQDNLVVTVLGDGFGVEIDGNRLTLTSMGNEGLVYRAA